MHEVKRDQYCQGILTKALKLQLLCAKASDFGESQCPQQYHFRHLQPKVEQEHVNQHFLLGVFPCACEFVQVSTLLGIMWFHHVHTPKEFHRVHQESTPPSFSGPNSPSVVFPVRQKLCFICLSLDTYIVRYESMQVVWPLNPFRLVGEGARLSVYQIWPNNSVVIEVTSTCLGMYVWWSWESSHFFYKISQFVCKWHASMS